MAQVVSLLTIDARGAEVGSAAYVRAMKTAQAAVDRLADAEERAQVAQARQTVVMTGQSSSIARTAAQWDRLRASIDPVIAATKAIEQAQLRADAAVRRGITTQEEAARVVDAVRRKQASALGIGNDNAPAGLGRHEIINLSRQAQDVFVSLSSGQSPLTVLIQQGSQIVDVFASSQATVGGFFRQLLGWLGPIAPALAAGAAAVAAFYSAFSVAGERADVAASLRGVGRSAGITSDELNKMAKEAADAAGVTVSSARAMAAEFTKTGRIAPEMTSRLIRLAKDYAFTTGQELEPAVKELATAFADPIKGAETLNQRLGFLDGTMQTAIRRAADMGDRLRAQRLITDGVAASVVRAEEAQSKWNRAWEKYISLPVGRVKEAVGSALIGPDRAESIDTLQKEIDRLQASHRPDITSGSEGRLQANTRRQIDELTERKRALEGLMRVESDRADLAGRTARDNAASREARSLFESANKDVKDAEKLNADLTRFEAGIDAIKRKREALGGDGSRNAGLLAQDNENFRNYTTAIDKAKAALKDYSSVQQGLTMEQDKKRRLDELDARAINDVTVAQKAATAAERVRIELRGTENSAAERSRMAEEARQRVLTEGKGLAVDQRRTSQDNVDAFNAETEAIRANGVAAAEIAKLKAQAAREVRGTGEDPAVRFQELLQEAHSKVNREVAEQNARLREQVQIGRSVNDRAAQQGLSEQQIFDLMQRQSEIQARINQLRAAGADDATIARAQSEIVALKEQELSVEQRRLALGMVANQRDQIAGLELEVSLIGQNADVRNKLLATMRAEQELRRQGIPLTSEEGQAYVANAATIAGLNTVKDSLSEIQSMGKDALKGFLGDLRAGKSGAEALRNQLDRVLDKLLDMSLNSLMGGNSGNGLTGLLGMFGKLFGGGSGLGTTPGAGGLYADGGYTGHGGKYDPAGVVHRGEFVMPADATSRIGVGLLENMRRGGSGYAAGGYASQSAPYMPPAAANQNAGSGKVNVSVVNRTTGQVQETASSKQNSDGSIDVVIDLVEARTAQRVARGQGALSTAMRATASGRQLRG